ncbi:LacI family transcriptional regulator [Spirochaetia bacterium]|nr:LacI family transcriptional regulator [Spirochaetia bacterium]
MPNTSIKDVAKHAGVSEATITRVVNNKGYVASETRKRVLKSIAALSYVPNRMASALKNNRTGIIGNVLPLSLDNPFFSKIAISLKNAALGYHYQILPMYHEPDSKLEERLLREVVSRMVEGIVFTGDILTNSKSIKDILSKHIPVIMIERPINIPGVDKVLIDNFAASSAAAEKYFSMGHKVLGFIGRGNFQPDSIEKNRFMGFKETLEKRNIELRENTTVFTSGYSAELGYEAMKKIIEKSGKKRPTGFFITSDNMVCGALQYLYDAKLRVPEDISIIGYDNTLSTLCSPPITSVALPYDEIGAAAITLFRERREEGRSFDKAVQFTPSYVVDRGSVRDLRKLK